MIQGKADLSAKVTLLVPTMNRPDFLDRLLGYYASRGFEGPIYIGDSSTGEALDRCRELTKHYSGSLNVLYREFPGVSNQSCIRRMAQNVHTPFVAYMPDDDFLIPSALSDSVSFLENHQDYVAVHGLGVLIVMPNNKPYGEPIAGGYYEQSVLEQDSAAERFKSYLLSSGQPLFSVHRLEAWQAMYDRVDVIPDNNIAGELLPACLSALAGKIGQIDRFSLVRTTYSMRFPDRQSRLFERLTDVRWPPSLSGFFNCVVETLSMKDGIDRATAETVVKRAYAGNLAKALVNKLVWQEIPRSPVHKMIVSIPGARRLWESACKLSPNPRHRMTLTSLSDPRSRDHAEFAAVLRVIRGEARDGQSERPPSVLTSRIST